MKDSKLVKSNVRPEGTAQKQKLRNMGEKTGPHMC